MRGNLIFFGIRFGWLVLFIFWGEVIGDGSVIFFVWFQREGYYFIFSVFLFGEWNATTYRNLLDRDFINRCFISRVSARLTRLLRHMRSGVVYKFEWIILLVMGHLWFGWWGGGGFGDLIPCLYWLLLRFFPWY
jgi:hypothetical protein